MPGSNDQLKALSAERRVASSLSQLALLSLLWLFASSGCGSGSDLYLPEGDPLGDPYAVVQVVAGAQHSCALRRDRSVACWGATEALGARGVDEGPTREVAGLSYARAISAGENTTCAVTIDGGAQCWGSEFVNVQKEGSAEDFSTAEAIALGLGFGCVTDAEGVHCWGENIRGQLAQPLELETSKLAVQALGGQQALLSSGETVVVHDGADTLCAWGDNSAKQVTASEAIGLYTTPECVTLSNVAQIAVGAVHVCVRYSTGDVACWGERYYGQLGNGGTDEDTADVAPYGTAALLSGFVVELALGKSHSCALLEDGRVFCFGLNHRGQVGAGVPASEDQVRTPVEVMGFTGPVIALGSGSSADHTCAVIDDGSVQCWGNNNAGQLGDGATGVEESRFSATPLTVLW